MLCYPKHANEVTNALSGNMLTNMIGLMACKWHLIEALNLLMMMVVSIDLRKKPMVIICSLKII